MEFINEEIKTQRGLTPEQIEGVKPLYENYVATLKAEWDKKANENAENILTGATKKWQEVSGIAEERKPGEKWADYYNRVLPMTNKAEREKVTSLQTQYEQKLKDFKGDESKQKEMDEIKKKLDETLQKYADYDTLKEKADKYDPLANQLSTMELEVSFSNVKPTFPDTVNPYESDAKWNGVKSEILKEWDIKFKDNKAIAINKENPYKIEDLKKLVDQHQDIKGLMTVTKQAGTGAKQASKKTIEGVPFEVPAELDVKERVELIRAQLLKEGLDPITNASAHSKRFAELNEKLTQKTA